MAPEQFANGALSTLVGTTTAGATSLIIASVGGFPAKPQFRIQIDGEIFLVTAISGNTYTVTPGYESTAQAAHLTGAVVEHVLTADVMAAAHPAIQAITTGASYTAAPNDGIIDIATGAPFTVNFNPAVMKPGKQYRVVDGLGVCLAQNITLNAVSGVFSNLSGAPSSFAMQENGMSAAIYTPDGINLRII